MRLKIDYETLSNAYHNTLFEMLLQTFSHALFENAFPGAFGNAFKMLFKRFVETLFKLSFLNAF